MSKISVIIPVYNTEHYLPRCIESILAQTFTDFELLLIDDGSKDNSGRICDEYAAKDSRIRVFHKKNGGVSSARNLGLDKAQGEWIAFVDSDDWIYTDYFEEMLSKSIHADLVVSSYIVEGKIDPWDKPLNLQTYTKDSIRDCLEENIHNISFLAPWCKLFNRNIIEQKLIRFNTFIKQGEDSLFNLDYLKYVSCIQLLPSQKYCTSRLNPYCASGVIYDHKQYLYAIDCISNSAKEIEKLFNWDSSPYIINMTLGYFRRCILSMRQNKSYKTRKKVMKDILSNKHIKLLINEKHIISKGKRRKILDCLINIGSLAVLTLIFSSKKIEY